ncbi:MAG TPA: hypothetical protein VES59_02765 [Bacteroidota bacterium]|nr:hypothetical protein [Bacteroidota bacterium]
MRSEVGHKVSLMGVFGALPDVEILMKDLTIPIAKLTFVLLLHEGEGDFRLSSSIKTPDGRTLSPVSQQTLTIPKGKRVNLAVMVPNFIANEAGTFTFTLNADKEKIYESSFKISPAS